MRDCDGKRNGKMTVGAALPSDREKAAAEKPAAFFAPGALGLGGDAPA